MSRLPRLRHLTQSQFAHTESAIGGLGDITRRVKRAQLPYTEVADQELDGINYLAKAQTPPSAAGGERLEASLSTPLSDASIALASPPSTFTKRERLEESESITERLIDIRERAKSSTSASPTLQNSTQTNASSSNAIGKARTGTIVLTMLLILATLAFSH